MESEKLRITHIITGLAMGGAEMMLYKLLKALQPHCESRVISLTQSGPIGEKISGLGVPVQYLGMQPQAPDPFLVIKLAKWLRAEKPHAVQTWMYHSDLLGGLASWLAGDLPLAWGLHNTTLDPQQAKQSTRWTVLLNSRLSGWLPDKIVCCSESTRLLHANLGYRQEKMQVIPNGFDLELFRPDEMARDWLRELSGLKPDCKLIGHVGRFDPQKDYPNLIAGAQNLLPLCPDVHFVLCGQGLDEQNEVLTGWLQERGLQDAVHLLGRRDDIPRIMAGLDLFTLTSSYGEAFPNVIGEAMACEIPCVVTDVGDSSRMVADTGITVPPKDAQALAEGWKNLLAIPAEQRRELGRKARQRVQSEFTLAQVASQYLGVYRELTGFAGNESVQEKEIL